VFRVSLKGTQDRPVPSEHHAQLDVVDAGPVDLHARAGLEPVLGGLLLVEAQHHPGLCGTLDQEIQRRPGVLGPAVGVDGELPHGSTWRARESRSGACADERPGSVSHTKVSLLPFGPGRPEEM